MTVIDITTITYVKDHYEVVYVADSVNYQTQFKAVQGTVNEADLKSRIENAYVLKQTGVTWGNITSIDYVTPTPPTQAQLDYEAKQAEVETARALKDKLSAELDKAYGYVREMNALDESLGIDPDSATVTASKAQLKVFIDSNLAAFNTAYQDYLTKKAELEAMPTE